MLMDGYVGQVIAGWVTTVEVEKQIHPQGIGAIEAQAGHFD